MATTQVSLSTRINYDTALRLDKISKETGLSKASIVEEALREWMEKKESTHKPG